MEGVTQIKLPMTRINFHDVLKMINSKFSERMHQKAIKTINRIYLQQCYYEILPAGSESFQKPNKNLL